jgi:hypothetical protein
MLRNAAFLTSLFIVGFLLILAGCDVFSTERTAKGRVQVLLTDHPLEDFSEANVTIRRVELLGTDRDGESTLFVLGDTPMVFNLLELRNGVTASLAEAEIPAGRYHQLRVRVDEEAHVVMSDGETTRLKVPSGSQTGIKIVFPPFDIEDNGDLITLTIDFDVEDSFVEAGASGKYIFTPVIKAQAMVVNGEAVDIE